MHRYVQPSAAMHRHGEAFIILMNCFVTFLILAADCNLGPSCVTCTNTSCLLCQFGLCLQDGVCVPACLGAPVISPGSESPNGVVGCACGSVTPAKSGDGVDKTGIIAGVVVGVVAMAALALGFRWYYGRHMSVVIGSYSTRLLDAEQEVVALRKVTECFVSVIYLS